jgi:phosphatidylglycerol---prolipoprotein diacylglyceryl transferase
MNFPVYFGMNEFRISAHTVFEVLAFMVGFRYFLWLRKRKADMISEPNRIWIIAGAAIGALLFSRLLGALENPAFFTSGNFSWLGLYASKTVVGGLLGGLIGVEIVKKIIGEKSSSGDLFTYPLILAIIIGRIGCFSSGLAEPTFGNPSKVFWAMDLGDGVPRHPVALYEIIFLLTTWILLRAVENRYTFEGGLLFKLFMISYLTFRLIIELIKPYQPVVLGISSIQMACIGGLIYYSGTITRLLISPTKILQQT